MAIAVHEQAKSNLPRNEYQSMGETPPAQEPSTQGKVFLVGAGPGDPELITLKALRCLHQADVVVYDRLICPDLLNEAPSCAEQIFVGKTPRQHSIQQEEINALLVHHARQGRIVVRLKGGDPFVFGRGGEEALSLANAGIPFEIVPGISSAIAVPAYAGIPVTHRDFASSVTIVTGHDQRDQPDQHDQHKQLGQSEQYPSQLNGVNWEALAALGGTLVILMGVEALSHIAFQLLKGGLRPDTLVAVIQQGTIPQQRTVTGTLANITDCATAAKIKSPAVIVIGKVVALGDPLTWFQTALPGMAATRHSTV